MSYSRRNMATLLVLGFVLNLVALSTQQRLLGLMASAGIMRALRGGSSQSESPLNQSPPESLTSSLGGYGGGGSMAFNAGQFGGFSGFGGNPLSGLGGPLGGGGGDYGGSGGGGAISSFSPGGYGAASYGVPQIAPSGYGGSGGGSYGGYPGGSVGFQSGDSSGYGGSSGGYGGGPETAETNPASSFVSVAGASPMSQYQNQYQGQYQGQYGGGSYA